MILSCESDKKHESNTLSLVKSEALNLIPDDPLTLGNNMRVTPVAVDSDRFLVKNLNNSYVNVFRRDGTFLYSFGESGRGPDEIERIFTSGFDDEYNVVIWDAGQNLLKYFDSHGTFLEAKETFTPQEVWLREHLFHYIGDGWIAPIEIPEARSWGDRESVALFNKDFSSHETGGGWDPFYEHSESIFQHPLLTYDPDTKNTWLVYRTSPSIRVLDESLDEIQIMTHSSANFKKAEEDILIPASRQDRHLALSEISLIMQPYTTDSYFLFYFMNQTQESFQTMESDGVGFFVAVYDRENYSYLGELPIPGALTGVIDNKLMILLNDDPDDLTIGLYEVQAKDRLASE